MKIYFLDPSDLQTVNLSVAAVERYARSKGWTPTDCAHPHTRAYTGPLLTDSGEPIMMTVPDREDYFEKDLRLAEAISTLAAAEQRAPQETLSEILQEFSHQNLAEGWAEEFDPSLEQVKTEVTEVIARALAEAEEVARAATTGTGTEIAAEFAELQAALKTFANQMDTVGEIQRQR